MDPKNMGFRSLRVINEDWVVPGTGFPDHSHEDMEILTFVLDGEIEHRDSLGNISRIQAEEVQRMSAGTGITHSEMNPSPDKRAHALQVWIIPDRMGVAPDYQQKHFAVSESRNQAVLVASPDARQGSLQVNQDAFVYLLRLDEGVRVEHELAPGRGCWLQIVRGIGALNDTEMREGDGAAVELEQTLVVEAESDLEAILFDLS